MLVEGIDVSENRHEEQNNHYFIIGVEVSHMTVCRWVDRYSKMTASYLNEIVPRVGNWFRADEVWVKISCRQCYLFASMDDGARY